MGKQIRFLQSQEDIDEFTETVLNLGLKIYGCNRPPISLSSYKLVTNINLGEFGNRYHFLVENIEKILFKPEGYDIYRLSANQVIEYNTPNVYRKKGETNIISNGRLWIDSSSYTFPVYKQFELLRKWIRKKYKIVPDCDTYLAPHIIQEIVYGKVIATISEGCLKLVNENLQPNLTDTTWKFSCKLIDGEWVDNTDERFYRLNK